MCRRSVVLGAAMAGIAVAALPPSALAEGEHAEKLCNKKAKQPAHEDDFTHISSWPIKSRRTGKRIGRVHFLTQEIVYRKQRRVCAVTLRRFRKHQRFTSISLQHQGRKKRKTDASYVYKKYAGPIIMGNRQGYCVTIVGRIGDSRAAKRTYCW